MTGPKKQEALSILQKQAKIQLLARSSKVTSLPENDTSKKEKPMPLFHNKPIYKGKKHDLL